MRPHPHRPGFGLRSRAFLAAGIVCLYAAAASAQIDRSQMLDQQRQARQQQYRSMQNIVRNMQPLEVKRITDVFQIKVDGKSLTATLLLPEPDRRRTGQFRLELESLPGPTYIQLSSASPFLQRRVGVDPAAKLPDSTPQQTFNLLSYDLPNPDTLTTTSIQSYPGRIHVERNTQFNDGHSMVRISEQRNVDLDDGGAVQLWVNHYGNGTEQPININIQAPDFPTLVRENPQETELYIRPLLRDLGQEQMFAPDNRVAWQVLADYWQPDRELDQKVAQYVAEFDQPDFRRREKALAELQKLDRKGVLVLRHLDRSGFSAEKNLMIDRAMAPYMQVNDRDMARLASDKAFLLDCLYSDDEVIRDAAFRQLKKLTGQDDLTYDPKASTSERFAAARAARLKLFPKATPATQPAP